MKHDYSLEEKITKGKQQDLRGIKFLNEDIIIDFVSRAIHETTRLTVRGVFSFNAETHDAEDMDVNVILNLMGFTFEKQDNIYTYCLATSEYEMIFKSKHFAEIKELKWDALMYDEQQSIEKERQIFCQI